MSHTVISFRALQLANEQRNAYGLRYNDFTRYRKHCANRTHRLRSSLKFTHGRGRDFKKLPPITPDIVKDGHLQLLLFEAERAWAYSQELSALALDPSNGSTAATLRHSATSRFRRAVNWSTQLLSLSQALYSSKRLSAENLLELTIYTLILNGRFLRARDEFQDALVQLSVARNLLDNIAEHATRSRDQALAVLFADDIGAEIRYCAHQLGNQKAYDVDGIVEEIAEKNRNELVEGCGEILTKLRQESEVGSKEASRKNLATLMWEGQPVPLRNPELVDVLLKVQEADAKVENAKKGPGDSKNPKGKGASGSSTKRSVAVYDAVLLALSDAEDVARRLVEAQQLSGSTSGASGVRDIHFVHNYIVYQLLSRRTERDLLLITALVSSHQPRSKSSGSQKEHVDVRLFPAVVKLLDTLLQNLSQMRTLGIVDESPDLASAVEARISFTKCRRCIYLARCYSPLKKYAEALTLMQRAQLHLREARSALSTLEPSDSVTISFYKMTKTDCDTLDEEITMDSTVLKRDWFSFNGGSLSTNDTSYKKPLFFDIALNYVELDMIRLQKRAGKQPPPAPKMVQPQVLRPPQKAPIAKAKAEEVERPATPEPAAPARGGLGGLLGGWWGRK